MQPVFMQSKLQLFLKQALAAREEDQAKVRELKPLRQYAEQLIRKEQRQMRKLLNYKDY